MGRSLVELTNVDPGFKADHVLTLRMLMSPGKYREPPAAVSFLKAVLEGVRATPGVISASSIHFLPLSGAASTSAIFRADQPQPPREQLQGFPISVISERYFTTMGIPVEGRDFVASDGLGTPGVAVINASLARQLFPNENAIGKRVTAMYSPNTRGLEIVGIAGDVRTSTIDREPGPALYIAHAQEPSLLATLVVRTQGEPSTAVTAVRAAIARVDSDQGVSQVQALDSVIANATARPRVQTAVFVMFGVLALIIAAVGLYGVMAYGVQQRRREIALQIALGASPAVVLRTVVREGVLLATIGTAVGAVLAWMSSGALEGLLYQIHPTDPLMFGTAATALIAVACLATLAPALRATRVDPLVVLREE
jgi:putative ABC transport system permease protein